MNSFQLLYNRRNILNYTKMGCIKLRGAVFILIMFTCINSQEPLNNNCDFSQRHQILTCIGLNPKSSDIGSMIKEDTHVLILKGSDILNIPSNYHINKNFRHITSYQLVENGVIGIDSFAFKGMENLRYLKLNSNQHWSTVEKNTFSGLSDLETLNIVNNSIQHLENDAFEGLSGLDVLEVAHNKFHVVPARAFKSLGSVTSLFLYYNEIETLQNSCFEGLTQTELLDISHNNLKVLKTSEFNALEKLRDLYLSFNQIEAIEGKFTLPNLKFLYIHHNKLTSISDSVFNSSPKLMAVDLSYNKIASIADNAFSELTSLDHVNLAHNLATSFNNLKGTGSSKVHIVV